MKLQLKPTGMKFTYQMGDESGYRYEIYTNFDEEFGGHHASVTMSSHGGATPESAILHLRHAAEHFLRQLTENTASGDIDEN